MGQVYQKRAAELRAFSLSTVALVYSNQAQHPSKFRCVTEQKVLSLFTELYLRQLAAWREECIVLYLKHSSTGDRTQTSGCTTKFNHVRLMSYLYLQLCVIPLCQEYVPLLEYFFAENPFPTHADKAFLAKKSAMTYRQIHVWVCIFFSIHWLLMLINLSFKTGATG
jgi:hypothetical protein